MMRYFALFLVCLSFAGPLAAKGYQIDSVRVTARVQPDGSVSITEHRTYSFDGTYTWANYTLDQNNFRRISGISIQDPTQKYTRSATGTAGTFQVTTNPEELNLKWFFHATDASRVFTIKYTLHGILKSGLPWAELYWPFISNRWKKPTQAVQIAIDFPSQVSQDSLYTWLRPPDIQSKVSKLTSGIHITALHIPASTALRARILFPSGILKNYTIGTADLSPATVGTEEQQYQQQFQIEQEKKAALNRLGNTLLPILAVLSLLIWLIIYVNYGKAYSVDEVPDCLYRLPSDERPAIIAWLMHRGNVRGTHFLATLCDLARRGYLTIHQEEQENRAFRKNQPGFQIQPNEEPPSSGDRGLLDWERSFYDFVMNRMDGGNTYLKSLTDQRSHIRRWFPEWARMVKTDALSRGFRDKKSVFGAWLNGIIQLILMGVSLVLITWMGLWGLLLLCITLLAAAGSFLILRRTKAGEQLYKQWNALKNGIVRGEPAEFHQSEFDKLFIYSLVLNISRNKRKKWLRNLNIDSAHIPWLYFSEASHRSGEHIIRALAALIEIGSQTVAPPTAESKETIGSS